MTGFLLGAAARGVPVILDGVVIGAAALVANAMAYRARNWWLAGHRSVEPAHAMVLERLRLNPVLDFQMRLGEGSGALVALGVLRGAIATLGEMATFEGAGVAGPVADPP
jgi:nicotinate-nucleotide--dimethylbenzimidazole phosphoribosyltransferase